MEFYDYPLDRKILQDGDIWPEAYQNLGGGEYPWLYTVVPNGVSLPQGLQTEVLAPLFIPDNNEPLEDEAFFRTGNYDCDIQSYQAFRQKRKTNPSLLPTPCETICDNTCPTYPYCNNGGGGGGNTPGTNLKPSGMLTFSTYSAGTTSRISASAPLKYVRVVGRRFFKIDKTYTDAAGNFKFNKRFPKKVTIIVKFKASTTHGQHSVRSQYTGLSFWKAMFPLKKNIGTFRGSDLSNLNYEFTKGSSSTKRKPKLWLSAVTCNTTEETRLFLSTNNLAQIPDDIRFYLYANSAQTEVPEFDMIRRSSTPLLNQHRWLRNELWIYGGPTLLASASALVMASAPPVAGIVALVAFHNIPQSPDIMINFKTADIASISASKVSMMVSQQLGVAYLDKLTSQSIVQGGATFSEYSQAIAYAKERYSYNDYAPFGPGNAVNSSYYKDVVAIWQAFSQHLGHTIADRIYGTISSEFNLQGKAWVSNNTMSSHMKYLEEFDPFLQPPAEYFNWIPVGLINDLIDNTNEVTPVNDAVSGFTYHDIEIALYNKPLSMLDFKNHLKVIVPGQSNQLDALFLSYGY